MTIKMVSVTEILQKVRDTADGYNVAAGPHEWFRLISYKTNDSQTPAIIRAIEQNGFIDPICIEDNGDYGWRLGNGHHRLAIAILLGLDEIPVDFSSWFSRSSTAHSDVIDEMYEDDDYELSSWISNTAVDSDDLRFRTYA